MTSIPLNTYVEQVDKLIDDNRLVEAIEHCRHILQSYPRHIDTYRVMGKALLEKQEYDGASDIFLRILSADPSDFISHVGLSIIYKEERQVDQALWHLERAFEIQPYNVAIQGELRKLYAAQTDTRPGVIPLTRGALARLYMQGELYQQAIAELRRVLAEEPSRMDLHVLLAEALWRDDHRIEAEEVCLNVLEELPNCIVANAILSEIWLQTGRIPEAKKYLQRLQRLTLQTARTLDKESIPGQAFATEGAFSLPDETRLEFLQTGSVVPEKPAKPSDDWVSEISLDDSISTEDSLDHVVIETESGMHSYDWLADISDSDTEEIISEADWFSDDSAKEAFKLSTNELNAEWLADLRGDEEDEGFQPLDLEGVEEGASGEAAAVDSESDWFIDEVDAVDETIAPEEGEALADAASDDSEDWLAALSETESDLEIDSTNLMDDNLADWAESEPHVVEEPKTPFWLSEMADEATEAMQLDPAEALDWMAESAEDSDQVEIEEPAADLHEAELPEEAETAVVAETEDAAQADVPDSGSLGDADDWLAALTEGAIDENVTLEAEEADSLTDLIDEMEIEATPEDLAALSDADDWLETAAVDLEAIMESSESEEDEFPNLAIPEIEGADNTDIPDWLDSENLALSEESEAAVSSEKDPQDTSQPEEPEIEPAKSEAEDDLPDALDWLEDLTSGTQDTDGPLPAPPIETEGMPSWLEEPTDDTAVDVVDEWDSQSAKIPEWLQDPVELADLDEEELLGDKAGEEASGLTGLLSEMAVTEDALPLDQMDSLHSDWGDEDAEVSLTDILGDLESESDLAPEGEETAAETMAEADSSELEEGEEIGLTGLLSNLKFEEDEAVEAEDDFLAEMLPEEADDSLDFDLADEPEDEIESEGAIDLRDLGDDVSLTELLSDALLPDAPADTAADMDDWLDDGEVDAVIADIFEADDVAEEEELAEEPEAEDEMSLTGMLANLRTDEDDETAVAASEDPLPDLESHPADELGLTELLAGIDYEEDAIDSEVNLEELGFDLEQLEPTPFEELPEPDFEPEDLPISAEDTTWLAQLEADTGALQDEEDDFDMAEETGLDWLTTPEEATPEEASPEVEVEAPEVVEEEAEPDGQAEDWDDAMSWLEELAAQHDEPVGELPSVAEDMLGEEPAVELDEASFEPMDGIDTDWLEELSSIETEEVGSELDELSGETAEPEPPVTQIIEDLAMSEAEEPTDEAELSWLDELGTDRLEATAVDEAETVPESVEDMADALAEDHSWLEELAAQDGPDEGETTADWMDLDAALPELDEADTEPEFTLAAEEEGLDWLDGALDDVPGETEDEAFALETDPIEAFDAQPLEEEAGITGVTDALKTDSGLQEAEEDLEDALAWLDELEEAGEAETAVEEPLTWMETEDEAPEDVAEAETLVRASEPDEIELALDRLARQVLSEGVEVPETAVEPLSLSDDELSAALDWIEAAEIVPAPEDIEAEAETAVPDLVEAEAEADLAAPAGEVEGDDIDLATMSEDPEAWLEDLLSDDFEMDIEMEPPPIKPSEDAVFVTRTDEVDEESESFPTRDEGVEIDDTDLEAALDDVEIEAMPEDPDAAVAWLDQMAEEETEVETPVDALPGSTVEDESVTEELGLDEAELDLDGMEDDPEAWLEQMLSGEVDMEVEMEPPPIKPSEDAVFVTDDASADEQTTEVEAVVEQEETTGDPLTETVSVAETSAEDVAETLGLEGMEDDPEAWLEQMLSGEMDMEVEMEPPPIKPSEDAVYVTDSDIESEVETEAVEAVEEPESTAVVEEDLLAEETDIIAEVPDDPDEAMAWLEHLAAKQGADIAELPSVTDVDAEPAMPEWMAQDLAELEAEPDLERVETAPDAEAPAEDDSEALDDSDTVPDEDVSAEMPGWLEPDEDDEEEERVLGQTDWLRALPEVDVDTWLSAEEEATTTGTPDPVALPETGPLSARPQTSPIVEEDDDLFEPVIEPSTGSYSVDESRLGAAQQALSDGRLDEAIGQFKSLVAVGSGMMTIIAELEQAAEIHSRNSAIYQLLGDAYMRNGQLQKALASYRSALDQL